MLWAARYICEDFDEAGQQRLRAQIEAGARETRGVSNDERMDQRLHCALLESGIRAIYETWPMQCRDGFSEDEGYCRDLLERRAETRPPWQRARAKVDT